MTTENIKNAIVTAATLSTADHGVLSGWLMLDYGGSGQGFGGHALAVLTSLRDVLDSPNYAGSFVVGCMRACGVTEFNECVGKSIRVRIRNGLVEAIGHIVKDDVWYWPAELFKEVKR